MKQIDLKDRKILYELDNNARQHNSAIAKKVGLSKDVVNYRIKQLENKGIVEGYHTIIDITRIGQVNYRLYLKFIDTNASIEKEIRDFLINLPSTCYVATIDGIWDLGVGIWAKSIYDFERIYLEFKKKYRNYVGQEELAIFTLVHHFKRTFLINKKREGSPIAYFGQTEVTRLDPSDTEILRLLADHARIPILEISKKLGLTPRTVAVRIKKLERDKIIQGYRANLNFYLIGYQHFKIDFTLRDFSRLKDLISYAYLSQCSVYVNETVGGADFQVEIEVKDKNELLNFVNELRDRFPEIRSWTYYSFNKWYKLLYYPEETKDFKPVVHPSSQKPKS